MGYAQQPELADSAWAYVKKCSGIPVEPGYDLQDVKWKIDPNVGYQLGLWIRPDTLAIDPHSVNTFWVIAHELLHFLQHLPKDSTINIHPMNPFAFPCKLMEYQNRSRLPL